jgi:DNA modification methylase
MTDPFYQDDWLTLYGGDCLDVMRGMPADSVDCVVTSPPYWGLRDYGTATWDGGDAECDHMQKVGGTASSTLGEASGGHAISDEARVRSTTRSFVPYSHSCGKCGATRIDSQLGLERTPEEYVANLVQVFQEVRRVLKPSGTCWLNLGDSYASGGENRNGKGGSGLNSNPAADVPMKAVVRGIAPGLKPKDLVGIPWRVAFALQADGWYLRSDIIWSKPNPMPESVTDRPTKSHEYLFLLTKNARYYFDSDAVREPNTSPEQAAHNERYAKVYDAHSANVANGAKQPGNVGSLGIHSRPGQGGRNIRSVWTIATRPYPGAHFAVFPPELPERCIKAGSSEKGVCPECGAPWERVVEREPGFESRRQDEGGLRRRRTGGSTNGYRGVGVTRQETTGWRPACNPVHHIHELPVPSVILDPFAGSGTVGMVANRLSRRAILIDLNPEYLKQQMTRNSQVPLGLTEGDAA